MQRLNLKLSSDYDRKKYQQHLFYVKHESDNKVHIKTFDDKGWYAYDVATIELSEENEKPEYYDIDYILSDISKMSLGLLTALARDTLEVSHIEWYGDKGSGHAYLKEFIYNALGYDIEKKEI